MFDNSIPKMAKQKSVIHGILLLDKPTGMSSNKALQITKRLLQARKAGHGGTLDPLAEGVLPIFFGEATKLSGFMLNGDKTYEFTCRLGMTTTTGDKEGDVIDRQPVPPLHTARIIDLLNGFVGQQEQVPPMYSALKKDGQPLYKLARQGKTVERSARSITIHSLILLDHDEEHLHCRVHCAKGTYIRTLAEDIGKQLRCGGHLTYLRRTTVAPFAEDPITLETLETLVADNHQNQALLPMDSLLLDWPAIIVNDDQSQGLSRGQTIQKTTDLTEGTRVRLYHQSLLLALGIVMQNHIIAPKRVFQYG